MKNQSPLVVIVSHSHWDREWYLPFETFRYPLTKMVETVLDLLDNDEGYQHFMLDGQTLLLEDIVEVRPDLKERIQQHARSGRLSIGPWYVLQDEFLVGGESLVRNMLTGRQVAREYGAPMNVGYIPDLFGHVSQMPRILQGCGLDNAVLWRGVGNHTDRTEWTWKAPNGAEVLCLWLRWNYSNARDLPEDPSQALHRLRADLDRMRSESNAGLLVWMNGSDHLWPQAHVGQLIDHFRREAPDIQVVHSGLEEAVSHARERLRDVELPVIEGELRRPGPHIGFLLPGILSSRSWQQREHDLAEWELTRHAESFGALLNNTDRGPLRHAWKTLLKCQPHDSICGCSTDVVHREVAVRIDQVRQMARALAHHTARTHAQDERADWGDLLNDGAPAGIVITHPHPYEATSLVDVDLNLKAEQIPFRLMGPQGEVPYDMIANEPEDPTLPREATDAFVASGQIADASTRRLVRCQVLAENMPPHGLRTLALKSGEPQKKAMGMAVTEHSIANALVSVCAVNGGLEITDKTTGTTITHRFEDSADLGDEYNYTPILGDVPRTTRDLSFDCVTAERHTGATLTLTADWKLPEGVNEGRDERQGEAASRLSITATLLPNSRAVAMAFTIQNASKDHRLRASFDLNESPTHYHTEAPFDWIERPAGEPEQDPASVELAVANQPTVSTTSVGLERVRFGLSSVGLREVELTGDGTLHLTVLRCVEWLSRSDLWNRPRNAGPAVHTPDAQGLGAHTFQYSLGFVGSDEDAATIHRVLDPLTWRGFGVSVLNASVGDRTLLAIDQPGVRLSAVKIAEEDERILVRLVGPSSGPTLPTTLYIGLPVDEAHLSDLDERPGTPLPVQTAKGGAQVTVDVPARDVITLALQVPKR
jgi:mannosylglycerate hydrolase